MTPVEAKVIVDTAFQIYFCVGLFSSGIVYGWSIGDKSARWIDILMLILIIFFSWPFTLIYCLFKGIKQVLSED